ncbi:MAG: nuclear transport factor 2 family protein [Gammaproteobacteria bacterium]|nr:nuclear transport factor 2 family protein [Gammaproteobacteria bacterium]
MSEPASQVTSGIPDPAQRDEIFKRFGRAFFKQDMDAFYEVVHPDFVWTIQTGDTLRVLDSRARIEAFFAERNRTQSKVRFEDVVFHHAPLATFMTYAVTGVDEVTGRPFRRVGVERYSFKDGLLAEKDVYSREAGA